MSDQRPSTPPDGTSPVAAPAIVLLIFAAIAAVAIFAWSRKARTEPASSALASAWPGYNRSLDGQRYSPLTQIDTRNVSRLHPVCELKLGEEGPFQTGPIVVGDTMFLTTARTTVAMNAATCAVIWRHVDQGDRQDPIAVNRGAAYLDGRVYRGMPGARLAALDAATGKVVWDVKVGEPTVSEFLSSAPIVWRGTVFIGLAGGDWGIRGRVMGFDAVTGREKWRFNTIPMGSERGAESWEIPATAERGGGGMWTSYTLDTIAGELFVPVGNPSPDFAPHVRPGANLFTNSVVVLDAATGALKWWHQATPNDGFDWDMSAAPMLYTNSAGAPRVAIAGKDGYLFSVDRTSHAVVFKTPLTTILNADKAPTAEGVLACPGGLGGVEWNGPALDPETRTIYAGTVDWCATFKTVERVPTHKAGDMYMGTALVSAGGDSVRGWVVAVEGDRGAVRWKFNAPAPIVAGVTPTAGGLLFTGDLAGNFYAFDKATGKVLYTTNTGGAIAGGVITYAVGGRQYVATTAGNVSRMTFQTTGSPRLIVMAVDGARGSLTRVSLAEVPPPQTTGGPTVAANTPAAHGQQLFGQHCAACHGQRGDGATAPALTTATRKDLEAIVAFVKNPAPPMPKLYPTPLSDADVRAVAEYVRVLQQAAPR